MTRSMAILTDVTRCIGCESCVNACKKTNGTGEDRNWRWQRNVDDLSATRWTTLVHRPENRTVRRQCRHCLEPACASACPVGALKRTPEGAVTYDSTICMGCRYCMMACPYGIPRYLWEEAVPKVRKCILCYDKMKSGELDQPACTKACPTQATIFGERAELLALAHERIRANPGRYIDRVFGEHEVGGSSVLYISDIDLSFLGWKPDLGTEALPEKTWAVLESVPPVFLSVGVLMAGTWWIIERRMRLQGAAKKPEKNEPEPRGKDGGSGDDGHA